MQFGILQADDSDRSLEMVRTLLAAGGDPAILLTLKPDALDESVQEQCSMLVLSELAEVPPAEGARKDVLSSYIPCLWGLFAMTQRLASVPGPVRERHRADFGLLKERLEQYRKVNHPEASKLQKIDAM